MSKLKKCFIIVLMLFAVPLMAQEGGAIRYGLNFIDFNFDMDSTTATTYTTKNVMFDKGYGSQWFTGGNYCVYYYPDSTAWHKLDTDSCTLGDTDSLFIYVKAIIPTADNNANVPSNDSLFITPDNADTGYDFDNQTWYYFDFDLPPCKGIQFSIKRLCDVGAINHRLIVAK